MRNEILNYPFDGPVDWRANPFGYLEWRHALNRHSFFRTALGAYADSGDEAVAAKIEEWLRSWIEASPCPVRTNGGGDPAWETLSVAVRIYGSWMDVFFGTLRSSNFSDAARLVMLKSLYAHAEHLLHHSVVAGNNWLVVESQALATIGLLFPEFRAAETWRREGFRRLAAEIERQVHPDGVDWELTPGYHAMAVRGFAEPMELATMNDIELPAIYRERVRAAFDFSLSIVRPDGTTPAPNDSGGTDGNQRPWLAYGARLFDDATLRWGSTRGAEGRAPEFTSRAFPDAGYYVMRSSWDADARWMFFDGGPLGFAHVHEDKLSFELAAYGTLFVVDPAIASYQHEPWTDFYRSAAAHNTVMVDGQGQNRTRTQTKPQQCRSVRGENPWASGRVLDAVCAEYRAGFGESSGDFLHRRRVLFVKPDYWLVLDEVEGAGEHDLSALFHFTPMQVKAEAETGRVRSERLELPNLEIVPAAFGPQPRPRLVCGSREPVQGWIVRSATGGRGRENLPAPVAIYEARAELPWRCAWLLVPYVGRPAAGVEVTVTEASQAGARLDVAHPDGSRDLFALNFGPPSGPGQRFEFGKFAADGWAAVARMDAGGRARRAASAGASILEGPGPAPESCDGDLLEMVL
jgi:hypothetical protein